MPDPDFVHADQMAPQFFDEKSNESVFQFELRSLLMAITCICVIFAVLRTADVEFLIAAVGLAFMILVSLIILYFYTFLYGLVIARFTRHHEKDK